MPDLNDSLQLLFPHIKPPTPLLSCFDQSLAILRERWTSWDRNKTPASNRDIFPFESAVLLLVMQPLSKHFLLGIIRWIILTLQPVPQLLYCLICCCQLAVLSRLQKNTGIMDKNTQDIWADSVKWYRPEISASYRRLVKRWMPCRQSALHPYREETRLIEENQTCLLISASHRISQQLTVST